MLLSAYGIIRGNLHRKVVVYQQLNLMESFVIIWETSKAEYNV